MTPASSHGFTLIELLVTITIIAFLGSMVLAMVSSVRRSAASLQCLNQQRQVMLAMISYRGENRGSWPMRPSGGTGKSVADEQDIDYWAASTSQQSLEWLHVQTADVIPLKMYNCPSSTARRAPTPRPMMAFAGIDPADTRGSWGVSWDGLENWPCGTTSLAYDPNVPKSAGAPRVVIGDRPVRIDGTSPHGKRLPVAFADGHALTIPITGSRITQRDPGTSGHHVLYGFDGNRCEGEAINSEATDDNVYDGTDDEGDGMTRLHGSPTRAWLR